MSLATGAAGLELGQGKRKRNRSRRRRRRRRRGGRSSRRLLVLVLRGSGRNCHFDEILPIRIFVLIRHDIADIAGSTAALGSSALGMLVMIVMWIPMVYYGIFVTCRKKLRKDKPSMSLLFDHGQFNLGLKKSADFRFRTCIYLEQPNPGKFQGGAQYPGYSLKPRVFPDWAIFQVETALRRGMFPTLSN